MRLGKCPICGSDATVQTTEDYYWKAKATNHEVILIRCKNGDCGCEKWYYDTENKDYAEALEDAAEAWNRRTFYV